MSDNQRFRLALFSKRRIQIVKVRTSGITTEYQAALHFSIRLSVLSPTTTGSLFYGDNRRETSAARAGTHREILRIYIGIQFNSSHSLNSTRKWMSLVPARYKVPALSANNRISLAANLNALNLNMDEPIQLQFRARLKFI